MKRKSKDITTVSAVVDTLEQARKFYITYQKVTKSDESPNPSKKTQYVGGRNSL